MSSRYLNFISAEKQLEKPWKEIEDFCDLIYDKYGSPKQYEVSVIILSMLYKEGIVHFKELRSRVTKSGYGQSVFYDSLRKIKKFGLIKKKDTYYQLNNEFSKALKLFFEQWTQLFETSKQTAKIKRQNIEIEKNKEKS